MADKLMADIAGGDKKLQHVETEDKSGPKIEKDIHIKENKHGDLMAEVQKDQKLQHVETDDKSAPKIEADVKVGENPMKGVMADIQKKA
eukprot:CAMPEP_0201539720 /NCGR_PEP_ID=MMETSP0161_2-20130828/70556_1 /ASSEMBLY_ACC=CAM_ASM_000251 /TAXON_ID=180227 /ORGANISM="Neoparamoeba aestuarina, Strain SoJaBio B1-5/56/2" /LENGTH=88 /DNA_ID=CAMNT_0047947133 /DNA_START=448 /DNA_END=714 /DNA_ORIENTATION=-